MTAIILINRKLIYYYLIFFLFALSVPALAQLDKTIRIPKKELTLSVLLKEISQQSKLRYSVNAAEVGHKKIKFKPGRYTLRYILSEIRKQACLTSNITGDHIIFVKVLPPGAKKECPQKQATQQGKPAPAKIAKDQEPPALKAKDSTAHAKAAGGKDPLLAKKDSFFTTGEKNIPVRDSALDPKQPTVSTLQPVVKDTIPLMKENGEKLSDKQATGDDTPGGSGNASRRGSLLFSPFIKTGFAAEELFYANAVVKAGIPLLHAVGHASTNFSSVWLRYGLGSSFFVSPESAVFLEASWGQKKKSFMAINDSMEPYALPVKQQFLQIGAGWERSIDANWSITVRAHYSRLTTTESSQHKSDGVSSKWYIVKPPYTIHNSTSTNRSVDGWLGVQLGIHYSISFH